MLTTLFRLLRAAVRGLGHLAVGLLALLILFEEWGWEPLHRALLWLGRLAVMRQLEAAIARLPPGAALAVLLALRREALQQGKAFAIAALPQRLADLASLYGIAELLPAQR